MLEFKFFGQASVRLDGLEVHLSTKKSLALLAVLALQGETDRSRLAALLWSRLGAERARKNLRQELYRLSSSNLGTSLELGGERVALKPPFVSDVQQFRDLIAAQDFARALEISDGGLLADWRSAGAYEFQHWLEAERQTLHDLRREALAQQALVLENSGAHREALASHLELLSNDELQEHHHVAVMRLHLTLGERLLALEQFKRLSRILRREVGLEPLPETLALVERIRSNQALEEKTANNLGQRTANVAPALIEREHLLERLENSNATMLVLIGEAGVGKTRLAHQFAGQGLQVFGREDSSATPLAPFAQAIRSATEQNPNALNSLEPVWRLEVARLIPEIEPNLTLNEAMPEGRSRFLEGITRAVVLLAGDASIVLDDLQYFDASSLEVLGLLARRPLAVGQRLVVTVRGVGINQQNQIAVLLDAFEREGLTDRFEVQPLSESGVQALVANLAENLVDAASISFLYAATGGNPLYTLETIRGLLESNSQADWSKQLESPSTLSQVVQKRLEGLGASVKRLLEAASVAGNGFNLEWLGEASALTDWEALESLERAVQAGLIETQVVSGETRGYRFAHDLVRTAILEALGTERERLVHRKLAGALEAYDAPSDRTSLHLERSGQAKRAVQHRVDAAKAAAAVFAYADALTHYAQALQNGAKDREAFFIRQARVTMLEKLDDRTNWDLEITALEKAADLLPDPKLEAAALLARAGLELVIGNYSQSVRLAQSARVHLDGREPLFSQALYREGVAYFQLSQLAKAETCFRSALESVASNDFERLGEIHNALSRCLIERGDLIAARIHNEDAISAYRRTQHLHGEVAAINIGGWISHLLGEPEAALEALLESFERAREYGLVLLQRSIIINLSAVLVTTGQLERAEQFIQEGLQLAREPKEPRLEGMFHTHLGHIAERRGDLGGFLRHFRQATEIFDRAGASARAISARLNLAHYFLVCGHPERAKPIIEQARRAIEATGAQNHLAWLEGLQMSCQSMLRQAFTTTRLEAALAASNRPELSARLDLARAKLELGDATEALEIVAGIESPPSEHAEATALQLSAQRALRLHSNAKLEQALNLLSAAEVPDLNKLSLYASVIATLEQTKRDTQASDAQTSDAQTSDAQASDAQASDAQTSDAQAQCDQAHKLMNQLAATLELELQSRFLEFWSEKLNSKPTLTKRH